ncbi:ester cyclase [Gymnodinialimonas ceratoperidinii]|uniref:Ester cyclase n=1 Tax=Gymnodinialimonas ceratoperidinii TaxID=2856823 RepID=A0A8F6TUW8_9RHOB|nr:ester cyclase [Gymnodinialimonas ceratoperidinii]QXT39416.1 ester cyclase [Gymnodinialimonas ceratoperidinii]
MTDTRARIAENLTALFRVETKGLQELAAQVFAEDARIEVSAPVGTLTGPEEIVAGLIAPLRAALRPARRRDLMVFGGENRRDNGGDWVTALTHVTGLFTAPLWGVPPSGKLVYLRIGEFWRVESGKIAEARLIVDLLDLIHQAGHWPLDEAHYGAPIIFPAPETQDGLCPANREDGAAALDVVETMLGALHVFDPGSFSSEGQVGAGGTWAPDFAWYGPGGIGSTVSWPGFVDHHRAPFLRAFPDRKGGNHYARVGDGNYAAVSGWPSMTMTHRDTYLGVPATGKALTLRVMDFYRVEGGLIAENWVLLDYIDLLQQMGVDVLETLGQGGTAADM